MTLPRVVMCSMWRSDANRQLPDRVEHLLAKAETYPMLRWYWVVGDSDDDTLDALIDLSIGYDVAFAQFDTGIKGDDAVSRLRRLSLTANHYLQIDHAVAEFVLVHESDLLSPSDIVNRFVAHAEQGRCPIAAWPTLEIQPGRRFFYDCWAYRKDGVRFSNRAPYHKCYRPDAPFAVDSFGSVFMFSTEDSPFLHMENRAVLDLCDGLRARGRTLWVDPTIEVIQPHALWQYQQITKEYA